VSGLSIKKYSDELADSRNWRRLEPDFKFRQKINDEFTGRKKKISGKKC